MKSVCNFVEKWSTNTSTVWYTKFMMTITNHQDDDDDVVSISYFSANAC